MSARVEVGASVGRVFELLRDVDDPEGRSFPPTELYSEGWMLRLLLDTAMCGVDCLPVRPAEGSRWYSEARLDSPFLRRTGGAANHLCEGQTRADAALGHFELRDDTEAGLAVSPEARQLVVFEAKMFSKLSPGTTRASGYDQAARNVACMAWTLHRAGLDPQGLDSLGFFVLAPREQLARESSFAEWTSRTSISARVEERVASYACDPDLHGELVRWLDRSFRPLLDVIRLDCLAWEDLLERVPPETALPDFYVRCLRYNRPQGNGRRR